MAIDSGIVEFEGEEGFEEFEEVQGQLANQGKPSFDLLLSYYLLLLSFLKSLPLDPSWVDPTYVDTMHTYPKYV